MSRGIVILALVFACLSLFALYCAWKSRSTPKFCQCVSTSSETSTTATNTATCTTCGRRTKSSVRPVLVVRNYNPESGFWWTIYNVLHASHTAHQHDMDFVILLDSGLYVDPSQSTKNWFEYYFAPVGANVDISAKPWISSAKLSSSVSPEPGVVYEFEYSAFQSRDMPSSLTWSYLEEWNRSIRILPGIQEEIDTFVEHNHMKEVTMIGVHYRGTDKLPAAAGNEDDPIHYEYSYCTDLIKKWLMKNKVKANNYKILACSDEQPFIEYCDSVFGSDVVLKTNSYRSTESTSGVHYDTSKCDGGNIVADQSEACKFYERMKTASIHRRQKTDVTKYKIGKDVLIDVMLLKECNVFFRSAGSVSNFPGYLNPSLTVIHMNQGYKVPKF